MALRDQTLAELHTRAQELGVERFRMLPRDELITAIEESEGGSPPDAAPDEERGSRARRPESAEAEGEGEGEGTEGDVDDDRDDEDGEREGARSEDADEEDSDEERAPRRRRRRGRRGGRGRRSAASADDERRDDDQPRGRGRASAQRQDDTGERGRDRDDRDDRGEDGEEAETEAVTGVLDRMPQGYGFLRLSGLDTGDGDVYVSASQIRRCELRAGDEVSGPARSPRRGERHRALVRVDSVNGQEPEGDRVEFEDLTAVAPTRRLDMGEGEPLARAVDLLTPLALGQRVLILAEPRSGRTTLLRSIGRTLAAQGGAQVRVLLADERPEEVTEWERAVPEAEITAATVDQEPGDQVRTMELALGHAKRGAEAGEDVVVIIDSLSRLALGYRDPARVKRLFGAGRELSDEGSGSLTMIATVLDTDDRGREVREALETTENVLIRLDAELAAQGIIPSLLISECRVSAEEQLRSAGELEAARALRNELAAMDPAEAARELGERIERTRSNSELLG